MITRKPIKFDAVAKLEIVMFEDKFGAQQIIQHPLTLAGYDADAEEAAVIALMQENETKWEAEVAKRSK